MLSWISVMCSSTVSRRWLVSVPRVGAGDAGVGVDLYHFPFWVIADDLGAVIDLQFEAAFLLLFVGGDAGISG